MRFVLKHPPLAHGVVDLIALAATNCDGVKILKGTQTQSRNGHQG